MRSEKKLEALGRIDPEFIESAAQLKKKKNPIFMAAIAAAALLVIGCGAFFAAKGLFGSNDRKTALAPTDDPGKSAAPTQLQTEQPDAALKLPSGVNAVFASMPVVPKSYNDTDYSDYSYYMRTELFGAGGSLAGFYGKTASQFLLSGKENENAAYSPLNVYMALSMLAETASGNTREQILALLGAEDIDSLREQADRLFAANYYDNDVIASIPAASLWINSEAYPLLKADTLETLAKEYHASSFLGEMGNEQFSELFRSWLNTQTHGLLAEQVKDLELDEGDIMHILTTLYFKVSWMYKFNPENNTEEIFHSPGKDEKTTFMHGGGNAYFELEGFTMAKKYLNENAAVWFVLPDEGTALDDLIRSGAALDAVLSGSEDKRVEGAIIHLNMPKFDVESQLDLIDGLKKLGVTDCFDPSAADFTELTDMQDLFVSKVTHGVRVIANEDGVEAAAYTDLGYAGAAMPTVEVDFTLDRPFMFVITSPDDTPLFVGTVYHPAA